MTLPNTSLDDITPDINLITSKPKIQGNDNDLLANDQSLDTRVTTLEGQRGMDFPVLNVSADVNPAEPFKTYLVDASSGVVTIYLPDVTPGDDSVYRIMLNNNGKHAKVTTVSGGSVINFNGGTVTEAEIPSMQTGLILKADGVSGYYIINDTRLYCRVVDISADTSFPDGLESGAIFNGLLADSSTVIVTIGSAVEAHEGFYAKFVKSTGENSAYRIKTLDSSFDETITENDSGFEICVLSDGLGGFKHAIVQDSRPSASNIELSFLPTANASVIEPTYNTLETVSQPETIFSSDPISNTDPLNPTSLGFWINDSKSLIGTLSERNINAYGQVRLAATYNRGVQSKFKYYEYDFQTLTLNPVELSETSYSRNITSTTFEQSVIGGTLPENTWATTDGTSNNVLVAELLAYKTGGSGGDNPVIQFRSGGSSPSKTVINVPVASVNHATLGGVVEARTSVPDGHIDNSKPLQLPELTTTERDAVVSPNAGMKIWNTTTSTEQTYDGTSWRTVSFV